MSIRNICIYRVIITIFCLFVHVLIESAVCTLSIYESAMMLALNDYRNKCLLMAARDGNLETVKRLIEQRALVNVKRLWDRRTPLMYAAESGNCEIVKELLNASALVHEKDGLDKTALTYAIEAGNSEIVKELLNAGALVNERNDYGCMALIHAVKTGNSEMVKQLLNAGALVNEQDSFNRTALVIAVTQSYSDIVRILLEAGAIVDMQDIAGRTALMEAVRWPLAIMTQAEIKAQRESIKFLIIAGARTDLRDYQETTPFDIASSSIRKIMHKAVKKRDRLVLQRYELVRDRLYGASVLADLVFDYEGLKELFDSLQVSSSDSQCGGCCLQ